MKRRTIHAIWLLGVSVGIVSIPSVAEQPASLDQMVADFESSDWPSVLSAKLALESQQERAVPRLAELTTRHEQRKLENTADLIYPGATQFYGHGYLVDYDIDRISMRAGWALEELTFLNFGFRLEVTGRRPEMTASLEQQRAASMAVQRWWNANRDSWTRLVGLMEALESTDPRRQSLALQWIRNGTTRCDGLTREWYREKIFPRIEQLVQSQDDSVAQPAKYLVRDFSNDEWWWYEQKKQ